jgi:hypothetical protein
MLVPPSGRNATAAHAVEAMLRTAGGNAELVRKAIARCQDLAAARQDWGAVDTYAAQLAALALRGE